MKIYLDDIRAAPRGWTRTYTVDETIEALRSGKVTQLSLDYDLDYTDPGRKGLEVLTWIARIHGADPSYPLPRLHIHTANPDGAALMAKVICAIEGWPECR